MASENLAIDQNTRNVLGGITNDASEFIKNLLVNPATGRLLVDAHVTSTNTEIGDTIPGGTAGSVLFLGAGSTLEQDNANFFYDSTNHRLGLGTTTPTATEHIVGTFRYVDGNQTDGYVLTSDASGNATWEAHAGILDPGTNGVVVRTALDTTTARTLTGTSNRLTVTNGSGVAGNPTFDIAGTYVGQNSITTLGTIGTGTWQGSVVDLAYGGTGANLTAPVTDKLLGYDSTDTSSSFIVIGTGLTYTHATHTLSSTGSGGTVTSVSGTTNRITSTGGATPVIDISASYIGQSSITTLGTISSGVWNGTAIDVAHGGTGDVSLTAYAVLCGGTTSTGAVQSIASVGTSGQVLTSNGAGALPTFQPITGSVSYTNGVTTRAGNTGSGSQTIAHGLGTTPKKINLTARKGFGTGIGANVIWGESTGCYNGTTNSVVWLVGSTSGAAGHVGTVAGSNTTNCIQIYDDAALGVSQVAVATFDATDITLTWTEVSTPSGDNIQIMWEAEA